MALTLVGVGPSSSRRPGALQFFFSEWSAVSQVTRDIPFMRPFLCSIVANYLPALAPLPLSIILWLLFQIALVVAFFRLGWKRVFFPPANALREYHALPLWFPRYFVFGHCVAATFAIAVAVFYPDYKVGWVRGLLVMLGRKPKGWVADTDVGVRQAYALDTCMSWFPVSLYICCALVTLTGYRVLTPRREDDQAPGALTFEECAVKGSKRAWLRNNKLLTSAVVAVALAHSSMNLMSLVADGQFRAFHSGADHNGVLTIALTYIGVLATAVAVLALAAQVLELILLISAFSNKARDISNEPFALKLDNGALADWWVRRSDFAYRQAPTLYYIVAWQVTLMALSAVLLSLVLLYRALVLKTTMMHIIIPFGVFSCELFLLLFMLLNAEVDIFVNLQSSESSLSHFALALHFADRLHTTRTWFEGIPTQPPSVAEQQLLITRIEALRASICKDPHATVFGVPVKPQFRNVLLGYAATSVAGVLSQAL